MNTDVDAQLRLRDERNARRRQTRGLLVVVVCLALAALTLAVLWRFALADQSDVARQAEVEAGVCRDAWGAYAESGEEADRSLALSALYAYSRCMEILTEDTHRATYATVSREVYDRLSREPTLCAAWAPRLEKLFSQLAGSIYHPYAQAELSRLNDAVGRGELPKPVEEET